MSHTRFLYHIVFGTKDRVPMIAPQWEDALYAYLAGIVRNHGGLPLAVGGVADHIHLLARLEPKYSFSEFMREMKASSSGWVRRTHEPKFSWQRRYGAFTVSESVSPEVERYVKNQKEHHGKRSFEDEYKALLRRHNIDFDETYLWD